MKQIIWLIFGWISNEAEVSIESAKNIIKNFDHNKYNLVKIFRSKDNNFYIINNCHCEFTKQSIEFSINNKIKIELKDFKSKFDIAFLITHWKYGEDWVLQSILELENMQYTGCRVVSSSVCMNKAVFKNILKWTDINQVDYEILDFTANTEEEINEIKLNLKTKFKLPIYIKPANSGSSIGITKLTDRSKLDSAILEAKEHDDIILIEEWLENFRELEVWVIWNSNLKISNPWELVKDYDFYSFDEKYVVNNIQIETPAKITDNQSLEIKKIAKKAYKLYDCKWFARIDFFLHNDKIYLNEINTIPGFTEISAFPVLMKSTGMTYTDIINEIIELAY